jgi:5-methylcytosine-specific restriction endonuclease McrA
MKLEIELVPATTWEANLRKVLSQSEWDKIRKKAYADYGYKCGICGVSERLSCHEIWNYDDINHIQTLKGFIALCDMCHHVKHIGRAGILAREGKLNYSKVVEHFMNVNNCDLATFKKHREEAFKQWAERSTYEWKVDIGKYRGSIKNENSF